MYRRLALIATGLSMIAISLSSGVTTAQASPTGEPAYADGQTFWMHSSHVVVGASGGLLTAPPIYLLGFPVPQGTTSPITLPSGYQPQCNPCLEEPIAYHDHLLTGEPGAGTEGTAGDYKAPWRIVVMLYSPTYAYSPSFVPITSDAELVMAEAAGDFLPINPGGSDPYEIWTNNVLICPLVRAG